MTFFRACHCLRCHTSAYRVLFAACALTTTILAFLVYTARWQHVTNVPATGFSVVLSQLLSGRSPQPPRLSLGCSNVLTNMVAGQWMEKRYAKSELDDVQRFLHIAREQHFLPYNLQRPDNRCGNVSFGGLHDGEVHSLLWFRALCDPNGDRACCYDNVCQARTRDECRCPDCFDLRQRTHGELAEWTPSDPTCKMALFRRVEDLCQVLQGMTIYFIGDSLVRHLYLAVLQLIRADSSFGPMMEYTPLGMKMACNEQNMYLGMCVNVLDRETWECQHTVKLKFMEYPKVSQSNLTLEAVDELRNVSNAMLVFGIGIHDNFDTEEVKNKVLLPVVQTVLNMTESRRPSLLWSSVHAPGLLKTPRVPSQRRESMVLYNEQIRTFLKKYKIPEFNTFNVTDGTVSYDGLHYGKGVNHAKAQIFLNYILDFKQKHLKGKTMKTE